MAYTNEYLQLRKLEKLKDRIDAGKVTTTDKAIQILNKKINYYRNLVGNKGIYIAEQEIEQEQETTTTISPQGSTTTQSTTTNEGGSATQTVNPLQPPPSKENKIYYPTATKISTGEQYIYANKQYIPIQKENTITEYTATPEFVPKTTPNPSETIKPPIKINTDKLKINTIKNENTDFLSLLETKNRNAYIEQENQKQKNIFIRTRTGLINAKETAIKKKLPISTAILSATISTQDIYADLLGVDLYKPNPKILSQIPLKNTATGLFYMAIKPIETAQYGYDNPAEFYGSIGGFKATIQGLKLPATATYNTLKTASKIKQNTANTPNTISKTKTTPNNIYSQKYTENTFKIIDFSKNDLNLIQELSNSGKLKIKYKNMFFKNKYGEFIDTQPTPTININRNIKGNIELLQETLIHELTHYKQFKAIPNTEKLYFKYEQKFGYWNNPFEIQARYRSSGKISLDIPVPKGVWQRNLFGTPIIDGYKAKPLLGVENMGPEIPEFKIDFNIKGEYPKVADTATGLKYTVYTSLIGDEPYIITSQGKMRVTNPLTNKFDIPEYPLIKPPIETTNNFIQIPITKYTKGFITQSDLLMSNPRINPNAFIDKNPISPNIGKNPNSIFKPTPIKDLLQKNEQALQSIYQENPISINELSKGEPIRQKLIIKNQALETESQLFERFQTGEPVIYTETTITPNTKISPPINIGLYAGSLKTNDKTINALFQINENKITTKQNIFSTTDNKINTINTNDLLFKTEIKTNEKIIQEQNIFQEQKENTKQDTKQNQNIIITPDIISDTRSDTRQTTSNIYNQITRSRNIFRPITIKQTTTKTPPATKIKNPITNNNKQTGYNVFVKTKGVFKKVNTQPLIKSQAIGLGSYKVGNTASATFKILPTEQQATGKSGVFGNLQNFYTKGNLFIERPSKRIKSQGELIEITYKGINANKNRKKGIFNNNKTKLNKIYFGG